jgi:GR25 family glycosyltransferase involved in LPS biosynthesis
VHHAQASEGFVMVDYKVGVVGHVDRIDMLRELSDRLHPDLVNVDDGTLGCAGNHAFMQTRLASEPGWSVILEDDAVPSEIFHAELDLVLTVVENQLHPDIKIVSLYLGTSYPQNWQRRITHALATDPCFVMCPRLLHAVGYAIAPEIKKELAEFMSSRGQRGPGMAPDEAMSLFLYQRRLFTAYTNPSLVDHRDERTVIRTRPQSFNPDRRYPRHAHNIGQRLTWTDSTVMMDRYGN